MGWLINNYFIRGIATFFVGTGLVVSQLVVDPEASVYKNLNFYKFTILTEDGITIAGTHIRSHKDCPAVIIIVHGICCFRRHPDVMAMAKDVSSKYDVITIDMRGHGESEGEFTGGTKEMADVRAAIDYAKWLGYKKIGLIGLSAGGIASLGEEAKRHSLDAMVLVGMLSDPQKVKTGGGGVMCNSPTFMQAIGKVTYIPMGTRIGVPVKIPAPIDFISKISIPVLFIHGKNDWIIDPEHSKILYAAANEPKKLVILDSAEHAEILYSNKPKEFYSAVMEWFEKWMED